MTSSEDANLFESLSDDSGTDPQPGPAPEPGPILFVTNRYNLLEFLSARMILPSVAVPKYYSDLLDISHGYLPLVRGPIHSSISELVNSEDPTAFPVALEIDPAGLVAQSWPAICVGGTAQLTDRDSVGWALTGVIPLAAVPRVHFRSQAELDEHAAREYENIPTDAPTVVTAELFGDEGVTSDELAAFLGPLDTPSADIAGVIEQADRTAGARTLALQAAPADVSIVRQLMKLAVAVAPTKPDAKSGLPPLLPRALSFAAADTAEGADMTLFDATVASIRTVDRTGSWKPLDLVRQIRDVCSTAELLGTELDEIDKNLRPIEAIIRNERDFKPFEPGIGLDSAKALLMALLRPEPDRLLSWPASETGADSGVMMLAAALVGLMRGHKKLSLEYRCRPMDELLADRITSHVAELVDGAAKPPNSNSSIHVELVSDEDGEEHVIARLDDDTLFVKDVPPPRLVDVIRDADLSKPATERNMVGICRALGWSDCVHTVVGSNACNIDADAKRKITLFRFAGFPEISYELDGTAIEARLRSGVSLTKDEEAALVRRLLGPARRAIANE